MAYRQDAPTGFGRSSLLLLILLLTLALLAGGCTTTNGWGFGSGGEAEAEEETAPPQPYHISGLEDLLIPSEMDFERDKSMVVQTESFAGGVLQFRGRVEINSLSDFFTTTMQRQGWKLAGSVKHKDVMLAFTKPHKTCTIIITGGDLGQRATVRIYLTEDIAAAGGDSVNGNSKTVPFSF